MDVPANKRTAVYILPGLGSEFMAQALIYFEKLAGASKAEIISEWIGSTRAACPLATSSACICSKQRRQLSSTLEGFLSQLSYRDSTYGAFDPKSQLLREKTSVVIGKISANAHA